jgi:hypothetical protein
VSAAGRLHQFVDKKPCFYCGAHGPSIKEHVPPRAMFAGFECDRITVPSCPTHNTDRSITDASVIMALRMSASWIYKNAPSSPRLTPNVVKAIGAAEPTFGLLGSRVQLRPYLSEPRPRLDSDLPYLDPAVPIDAWVRQLTAGLVWSVVGEHDPLSRWDETNVWSQNFVRTDGPITSAEAVRLAVTDELRRQRLNDGHWYVGWAAMSRPYPRDIYRFDVRVDERSANTARAHIVFRHRFYNDTATWYAVTQVSDEAAASIARAARLTAPAIASALPFPKRRSIPARLPPAPVSLKPKGNSRASFEVGRYPG